MIVDTDVLIWYFRGNKKALNALRKIASFSISCITQMELLQGAKNKREQSAILGQFREWDVSVLQLSNHVSERAVQIVREHSLSSGVTIADALIAATAIEHKETLLTANAKHFEFIPQLAVKRFNP